MKSPQPQSCLWKASRAEGLPPGGPPALRSFPLSPPSAPVLPSPAPPLAPLLEAEHHTSTQATAPSLPAGSQGGPQGRECGLESPEAVAVPGLEALQPARAVGTPEEQAELWGHLGGTVQGTPFGFPEPSKSLVVSRSLGSTCCRSLRGAEETAAVKPGGQKGPEGWRAVFGEGPP